MSSIDLCFFGIHSRGFDARHSTRWLDTLIGALAERPEVKNLTAVSNNAGSGDNGLGELLCFLHPRIPEHHVDMPCHVQGKLLRSGQIGKMIASYIGGCVAWPSLVLGIGAY